MGALAGGSDGQANVVREAATAAPTVGHGQPRRTPHTGIRRVVVRTRRDASLHAAQRVLAEHDRIYPAHLGPPRPRRPNPSQSAGDHQLVGDNRACLERRSNAVRMGGQTQSPSRPSLPTSSSTRRLRSLHAQAHTSSTPIHGQMATFRSSDPLVRQWTAELHSKFSIDDFPGRVDILSFDLLDQVSAKGVGLLVLDEAHHFVNEGFTSPYYD